MAGTVLPDDVIREILAKLHPKSRLRFKCVCKTWYAWLRPSVLICQNSKTFSIITIESLLTAKNKTPTPLSLPWETLEDTNPLPSKALFSLPWWEFLEDTNPLRYKAHRLVDTPGNYLIGSCNGLVCVDHISIKSGTDEDDLILWNPSTGKFRRLPRCSRVRRGFQYIHFVWFGYDESIHDYKLVWVDYHQGDHVKTKVNVFTLKSNAWRTKFDTIPSQRGNLKSNAWRIYKADDRNNPRIIGVLSNGAIHWRTTLNDRQPAILALDLGRESFKVLDFPNYPFDPRGGGGCLAGECSCRYDAGFDGIKLRIMKEYGLGLGGWDIRKYYPILFSSGKEILAVFDRICLKHASPIMYGDRIIKFRIEEGAAGEKVTSPEKVLDVTNESRVRNNIVLHMESLVSPWFQELE